MNVCVVLFVATLSAFCKQVALSNRSHLARDVGQVVSKRISDIREIFEPTATVALGYVTDLVNYSQIHRKKSSGPRQAALSVTTVSFVKRSRSNVRLTAEPVVAVRHSHRPTTILLNRDLLGILNGSSKDEELQRNYFGYTRTGRGHTDHKRVRRTLYQWDTFTSSRYQGYQYGFPPGSTRNTFCIRNGRKKTYYDFEKWPFKPYQDEVLLAIFKECYRKRPDCTWGRMSALKRQLDAWFDLVKTGKKMKPSEAYRFQMGMSWDDLSLCYIFMECEGKKGRPEFCPRPCNRDPCKDTSHTSGKGCVQTNHGMFSDNYACRCAINYEWDDKRNKCERIDVCRHPTLYPCQRKNTQRCKLTENGFICQCKQEYAGVTCKDLRDACLQNYDSEKPRGAVACGVHGTCTPIKGSTVYSCTCDKGWTDEPKNSWPDCKLQEDKCKSMLCHNGHCVSSKSQLSAVCACDKGFGGADCSKELPHWNAWAPWENCMPTCGNPRNRKRIRACSKPKEGCRGQSENYQPCAPNVCLVPGVWAEWESWTLCSATCEGGQRVRTRECFYDTPYGEDYWGTACPGPASATEDCHTEPCRSNAPRPKARGPDPALVSRKADLRANTRSDGWKPWGDWGKCSMGCGQGVRSRTRQCVHGPDQCPGDSTQSQVEGCNMPCDGQSDAQLDMDMEADKKSAAKDTRIEKELEAALQDGGEAEGDSELSTPSPDVSKVRQSSKGHSLGLAVGLTLTFIAVISGVVYYKKRRAKRFGGHVGSDAERPTGEPLLGEEDELVLWEKTSRKSAVSPGAKQGVRGSFTYSQ